MTGWLVGAAPVLAALVLAWPHRTGRLRGWTLAGLRVRVAPRPVAAAVVVLVATTGAVVAGPVSGTLAGGYAALAARAALRRRHTRDAVAARTAALDDLCALAADLRAGLPGSNSGDPSSRHVAVARLAELRAAVWRLADRTGAPVADLVERIEADARGAARAGAVAGAQIAGVRATAVLLAALPLGGLALGYGMGVDPLHVLLHTPVGAACALAALLLQVGGLSWADRITRTST